MPQEALLILVSVGFFVFFGSDALDTVAKFNKHYNLSLLP